MYTSIICPNGNNRKKRKRKTIGHIVITKQFAVLFCRINKTSERREFLFVVVVVVLFLILFRKHPAPFCIYNVSTSLNMLCTEQHIFYISTFNSFLSGQMHCFNAAGLRPTIRLSTPSSAIHHYPSTLTPHMQLKPKVIHTYKTQLTHAFLVLPSISLLFTIYFVRKCVYLLC